MATFIGLNPAHQKQLISLLITHLITLSFRVRGLGRIGFPLFSFFLFLAVQTIQFIRVGRCLDPSPAFITGGWAKQTPKERGWAQLCPLGKEFCEEWPHWDILVTTACTRNLHVQNFQRFSRFESSRTLHWRWCLLLCFMQRRTYLCLSTSNNNCYNNLY